MTRTLPTALSVVMIASALLGPSSVIAQRFDRFDPEDWITLRDFRFVTSVAVSNEIAYFGTTAGVERFDTLRDRWLAPITTADGLPHERVTALVVDPTGGELWIGTARGVSRYTEFIGEVEHVFGPPPTFVEELKLDPEAGIVFAWVAGGWWRARVASPSMERSPPPPRHARGSIDVNLVDPFDLPWTDPLYVESQTDHFQSVRLTELYQDLRGDFYVGTWGDNGRRWGGARFEWEPLVFGLGGRGGGPIVETTDGMWFVPIDRSRASTGPAPAAIAFVDRQGRWSHVVPRTEPELPTAFATSAAAAGDTLYLGSDYGLTRYAEDEWKTHVWTADPPIDAVTALHVDGPRLWVGTPRGLTLWDRETDQPAAHFLNGRSISALAVSDDAIFVGTNLGLYVGQRDPNAGAGFAPDSFVRTESRGSRIRALALRDTLLVVATGVGLGVFNRSSGAWRFVTAIEGRLETPPLAVAIDDQQVWVGTDRGLARWRLATGEWDVYRPTDGLAGLPVRHLWATEDAVWASTPEGVSRFGWRQARR